ncbi:MAG: hypothetical protein IPO32_12675 [Crocinitomicaceae bacterium]|nr:hypothetical protein [Crocinitomicaceae bacterium]
MTDHDFLKLIKSTSIKMAIIGIGISAFGIFVVWLGLSGADPEMQQMSTSTIVILSIFGGLFLLVGLLLIILPVRASLNIKNGKHKLLNAIQENDTAYALWIYEYVTKVRSGPASNTDHKIWIMCADKNHFSIDVKKNKAQEVIDYLVTKFPDAVIGYTKEIEEEYNKKVPS